MAYVPAEVEVIQSEDVVVPAMIGLGLDKAWAKRFGSEESTLTPSEIMDRVSKMLTVKMRPDADDVVYISVQDDMRQEAADMANAIAKQYAKKRADQTFQEATETSHRNYDAQIADLKSQIADSRANWEKLKQSLSAAPNGPQTGQIQSQMAQEAGRIDVMEKRGEGLLTEMHRQILDNIALNVGVRILAPAY